MRLYLDTNTVLYMLERKTRIDNRVIIAQEISDKATLVSSDGEFGSYEEFGLDFIYNER